MAYLIATTPKAFIKQFEKARASGTPLLLECMTEGCPACHEVEPLLKQLGAVPTVTVLAIDLDAHEKALKELGWKPPKKVDAFPQMFAYKAGAAKPFSFGEDGYADDLDELKEALGV